jgi:phage terminase small subunit
MTPPKNLTEEQKAAWEELIEQEYEPSPKLEALAVQISRMREAQHRIDVDGLIVEDERGTPVKHPAIEIEKEAQKLVFKWSDEI